MGNILKFYLVFRSNDADSFLHAGKNALQFIALFADSLLGLFQLGYIFKGFNNADEDAVRTFKWSGVQNTGYG